MRWLRTLVAAVAASVVMPAPAIADPDTDFADELHTHGVYRQRDYNAWIGKISCERIERGVDQDANDSAKFVGDNLAHGTSTGQVWQFLAAALRTYCPENETRLGVATR
jgi:hypothetical protein